MGKGTYTSPIKKSEKLYKEMEQHIVMMEKDIVEE